MKKIFNAEGFVLTDIETKYVKNFQIFTYYDDSEYINYDNSYISLTRQKYSNADVEFYPSGTLPKQLVGGFIDGYTQQVTGITIHENIEYINDCLSRGRAINNFNCRSDLYVFNLPTYVISGVTKIVTGTTTASTGVYIVDTLSSITFTASFDTVSGYTQSFFVGSNGIKFSLYQRIPFLNQFNGIPILETNYYTNEPPDPTITGYSLNFSALTMNFNLTGLEGEFILKGFYKWTNFTYFSNLIGLEYYEKEINNPLYTTNLPPQINVNGLSVYDPTKDYYFIYLKNASKPTLFSNVITTDSLPLNVISIIPSFNGQTQFPIGIPITNGIFVTINGLTLSTSEYTYSSSTLYITSGEIQTRDIITIVYSNRVDEVPLQTESYKITNIVNTTFPSSGQKVIYNTSTNKYEYWLDYECVNTPVVTLNGQTLTNNIDYYLSISNKKRIIFENNLYVNDIITVFYNSIMNNATDIFENQFKISWSIPEVPTISGYFVVEVTNENDTSFSSPLFSGVTSYGTNQTSYETDVYISNGTYGDTLIARVTNYKDYITILGELIQTSNTSDNIKFTIKTNALNNY